MGFLRVGRNAGVADFHGTKTRKKRFLCTLTFAPTIVPQLMLGCFESPMAMIRARRKNIGFSPAVFS
jgi:hypothetical protein